MPITVNQNYQRVSCGNKWKIVGEAALDGLYPLGGYLINPIKFGLDRIDSFLATTEDGYVFDYNFTDKKLVVLRTGDSGQFFADTPYSGSIVGERLYYNAGGGPFMVGETVTGGTSAATATVVSSITRTGLLAINVTITAGVFVSGETITGSISGSTGVLSNEAILVYSCPFPIKSIACILNGSTRDPLIVSAYNGTITNSSVRIHPGPIDPLVNLPQYWEAERLYSVATPTLLWCYSISSPDLGSNLYEVTPLTDLSTVTVDFEVTGV